jgi:glyoxylase-like metal-dependent hydrolase (beta-lactamase superfamily II)
VKQLLTAVALLLGATIAYTQDSDISFKSTEVSPGIHVLEAVEGFGGGSASVLIGDEHIVLIDDVMVPTAPALLAEVTRLAGRPVDFVINTHVHGDHVGGNALMAEEGSVVVAHDNIRKRLLPDPTEAGGEGGLPTVTFSDAVTFHVNGHEAYVYHPHAAHTDGDAVIHFRNANVIHAGDVHFSYVFLFIDLDNGGSVDGYLAAQRHILTLADDSTVIIAGHGKFVSTRADLQAAVDMLVDARARVQKLVDKGMSQDEVLAENPLADYHEQWNWSFITTERMTATLYRSLTSDDK